MTALVERTKQPPRVRLATPMRLRIWVLSLVVTAVALLVTASLLMSRVQNQVRIIGDEAAPQGATASDAASPAGQDAATRLGYAPLPESLRTRVAVALTS